MRKASNSAFRGLENSPVFVEPFAKEGLQDNLNPV
jgi:hypothetical protein